MTPRDKPAWAAALRDRVTVVAVAGRLRGRGAGQQARRRFRKWKALSNSKWSLNLPMCGRHCRQQHLTSLEHSLDYSKRCCVFTAAQR